MNAAGVGDLDAVAAALHRVVGDGGAAGLCWAVSVGDEIEVHAAGVLDPRRPETPMPTDGVFRIASVTKPVVAVLALQLVEEGLIGLDDPVDPILPELADRVVLVDPHGRLDGPTVPAHRPLTLRDLLSFRCGLGMDFDFSRPQPVLERMWADGVGPGPTPPACSPDEYMRRLGSLPLADHPGGRWLYHTGSDIASVLVERVRGRTLDAELDERVLQPAGMTDTGFRVRSDQIERLGVCRMTDGPEPGTPPAVWDEPQGRWATEPEFRSGAAGLVSTTTDLVRFARVLLRGGRGPGGRVLGPDLVAEMLRDHLGRAGRAEARLDDEGDSLGWGLGVAVRTRDHPLGWPTAGTYGWDGGLGSRWLVDPERDLCAVVLVTDAFDTRSGAAAMTAFDRALAAALA